MLTVFYIYILCGILNFVYILLTEFDEFYPVYRSNKVKVIFAVIVVIIGLWPFAASIEIYERYRKNNVKK